jgi:STE24 endopeptidase
MRSLRILLGVAVFGIALAASASSGGGSSQPPQPQPSRDDKRFEVTVTPEMRQHSRILDTLYFTGAAYGIVVLLFVLATGLSHRIRDVVRTRWRFLTAFLYFALLTVATAILEFPFDFYSDYAVPHQFKLSNQGFASWMGDQAKGLGLNIIIGGLIVGLALLGIRKVRRWWIALWLGSIPIIVILVVIAPVLLDPVFNKFEPLKDATLRQALLDQAARAGIDGGRVYQVNRSKQTTTMNAYVTGIGPTKRIVLWDTTLAKMSRDEILAVMAHEMGHYVLNHLWKGLAFGVLVSLIVCFIGQRGYEAGLARWGARWKIEEPGDPAALPWLLLVVSIIAFFLSPVTNGFSRHIEHQADIFGLELTHMNEPMTSAFVKFAEDSKVDPAPNSFIEFWRYSHPSLARRIQFVLGYKPWDHGQPNQLWKR